MYTLAYPNLHYIVLGNVGLYINSLVNVTCKQKSARLSSLVRDSVTCIRNKDYFLALRIAE